jgi:MoaA/NifB/PqqE/SkfB family radical SAM enzyme
MDQYSNEGAIIDFIQDICYYNKQINTNRKGDNMSVLLKAACAAIFPPNGKLRFINFLVWHGCLGSCNFCQVPRHKIIDPRTGQEKIMLREERQGAFLRLRSLSVPGAIVSILGGETTLKPALLLEMVGDISNMGFLINVVTNGYALTPDLISRLAKAGLHHLAISADCDDGSRGNLEKVLELHQTTRSCGVIPVINVLVGRKTEVSKLKEFCQKVFKAKCFVSILATSPDVGGIFSSADQSAVPTNRQLREIASWLAWKKMTTGLVTSSFSYLRVLFRAGCFDDGSIKLWHCSPHFRGDNGPGRGFIYIDSDGTIGPCQEHRSSLNILTIPEEKLSLQYIDEALSRITIRCTHCIYNCYVMEETAGLRALVELPTAIRFIKIKRTAKK